MTNHPDQKEKWRVAYEKWDNDVVTPRHHEICGGECIVMDDNEEAFRAGWDAALRYVKPVDSGPLQPSWPKQRVVHGAFNHTPRCNTGGCHD